ncbi:MAG TPA: tryptophan synthase subunit alpha [Thermoanaerobaculia bacterium]|nr:tryptophan synthase subunit alpha [Thermoanaerobaculia bacterium]
MNRVPALFRRLRRERRCGLIAYLTCGDPDAETTIAVVRELERAGADAIELGVPFSDPIADGPVIQAAAQRALQSGTTLLDVLGVARSVRERSGIPLVAFSYVNPLLRFGMERFAREAGAAGFDAVLLTDLLPEASSEIRRVLHRHRLGLVFLLAPTSSDERVVMIDRASDGFVYYVSTTGVTGTRSELDPTLLENLARIRARMKKPLAVGFGVSRPEHYQALRDHCDAVVVGSAIVRAIAAGDRSGAPARAADVVRFIVYHSTR